MVAARTVIRHPTFSIALWNNVVIANIQGEVDAEGVRRIGEVYLSLHGSYPDGIAGITMLRTSLTVGTSDTNAEAKRLMQALRHRLRHIAIVIEAQGFVASLIRAVVRTLNSVARSSVLSLAKDLDEAVRAVTPYVQARDVRARHQLQAELLQAVMAVRDDEAPG